MNTLSRFQNHLTVVDMMRNQDEGDQKPGYCYNHVYQNILCKHHILNIIKNRIRLRSDAHVNTLTDKRQKLLNAVAGSGCHPYMLQGCKGNTL